MVVVGRRDEHGVKRIAHLRKHFAVVGIDLRRIERIKPPHLRAFLLQIDDGLGIRFAERHKLASADKPRAVEERPPPIAAADNGNADLRALRNLPRALLSEAGATDVEERQRARRQHPFYDCPSVFVHRHSPV